MASQGGKGSKAGRAKRTPSNNSYKTSSRLEINRRKRELKDTKNKELGRDENGHKLMNVPRGTARYERRQMHMTLTQCPKHMRTFQLHGLGRCQLCINAAEHNVRATHHNQLFARRAKFAQVGA